MPLPSNGFFASAAEDLLCFLACSGKTAASLGSSSLSNKLEMKNELLSNEHERQPPLVGHISYLLQPPPVRKVLSHMEHLDHQA